MMTLSQRRGHLTSFIFLTKKKLVMSKRRKLKLEILEQNLRAQTAIVMQDEAKAVYYEVLVK